MRKKNKRLSNVISEFNIGIDHILEFLKTKSIILNRNPNAIVTDEMFDLLRIEFKESKKEKNDLKIWQKSNNIILGQSDKNKVRFKLKKSENIIYPLSKENLNALLNYFFSDFETNKDVTILRKLRKAKITLKEIEFISEKIKTCLPLLKSKINNLTQLQILVFAIDVYYPSNWNNQVRKPSQIWLIHHLRKELNVLEFFEKYSIYEHKSYENCLKEDLGNYFENDLDQNNESEASESNKSSDKIEEDDDWTTASQNPARNPDNNPWIGLYGNNDEAEAAYWNTQ